MLGTSRAFHASRLITFFFFRPSESFAVFSDSFPRPIDTFLISDFSLLVSRWIYLAIRRISLRYTFVFSLIRFLIRSARGSAQGHANRTESLGEQLCMLNRRRPVR